MYLTSMKTLRHRRSVDKITPTNLTGYVRV